MSADDRKVLLWGSAFVATHTILSHPPIRTKLIKGVFNNSDRNFAGIYSIVTLATLLPAAYIYRTKTSKQEPCPKIPLIEKNKELCDKIGLVLQLMAIMDIPLLGSGKTPLNSGLTPAQRNAIANNSEACVRGINRLTRHPLFWMITFGSLGNLLRNGTYSGLYFYMPIIIEGIFGSYKQDLRLQQEYKTKSGELSVFYKETNWFPGWGFITGKQSFIKTHEEIGLIRIGLSVLLGIVAYKYLTKKNKSDDQL